MQSVVAVDQDLHPSQKDDSLGRVSGLAFDDHFHSFHFSLFTELCTVGMSWIEHPYNQDNACS
jgi:hypothetical protein